MLKNKLLQISALALALFSSNLLIGMQQGQQVCSGGKCRFVARTQPLQAAGARKVCSGGVCTIVQPGQTPAAALATRTQPLQAATPATRDAELKAARGNIANANAVRQATIARQAVVPAAAVNQPARAVGQTPAPTLHRPPARVSPAAQPVNTRLSTQGIQPIAVPGATVQGTPAIPSRLNKPALSGSGYSTASDSDSDEEPWESPLFRQ